MFKKRDNPSVSQELMNASDKLSEQTIAKYLSTECFGRVMTLLPTINSTNQYIKDMAISSIPNGFTVIANEQTMGRGRRNKRFVSAKGEGIYMSVMLKLNSQQNDIRMLTICAAVAVSTAIENTVGVKADIKWVNDIFIGSKKVCGILTEGVLSSEPQELDTVIVGIGINTGEVSEEIEAIATSLQQETGKRGIRNQLIAEVLNQLESIYIDYTKKERITEILRSYESRLFIIGRDVYVNNAKGRYTAKVLGIDSIGGLIVKTEAGDTTHITTGEISLQ